MYRSVYQKDLAGMKKDIQYIILTFIFYFLLYTTLFTFGSACGKAFFPLNVHFFALSRPKPKLDLLESMETVSFGSNESIFGFGFDTKSLSAHRKII